MSRLTAAERDAWDVAAPDGRRNRSDAGNGELFAQLYADRVRYDHLRKRWMIWEGHRWREDDVGEVRQLAKAAARERYGRATEIADLAERQKESAFSIATENRHRIDAMLDAARTEPAISDDGMGWDPDPWLLGVANGAIDLRTGMLRAGVPGDRITLASPIEFDRTADCPTWDRFLSEVFEDRGLIDFIDRAIGYSLTGSTEEQCLFLCVGSGSNGKSVFLTVLRELLGPYATNTPFTTFEVAQRAAIPNDIAALVGRRLVTASEMSDGARLNEARIKALTGGDPATARFLHGEFFTFQPVLKLWLAANHRPRVLDTSHGFWRRVRLIPFLRTFGSDADPRLIDALRLELPGILARAVRGAVAWRSAGLEPPEAVLVATEDYRADSDPLAEFLEACCEEGPGATVGAGLFFRAYCGWASSVGLPERDRLSMSSFAEKVAARYRKQKNNKGRFYHGVALR